MHLDIVIPTLNRKEKLTNCLNSIFHSYKGQNITLHIYFSLKEEFNYWSNWFKESSLPIELHLLDVPYRVPDFWNSHLQKMQSDALCYLNDDILLEDDTFEVIFEEFPKAFPDYDGVMGLRQANLPKDQTVEGAFGIIGSKYAERFPARQVWCPEYERFFGDWETWQMAKSIDKFYFCIPARIKHLHPITDKALEDKTHHEVRKHLPKDKQTFKIRQSQGLLWGQQFIKELI